jgi:anti-sigma-K factor RskA
MMATNPFEMESLLGAYALDAVTAEERRAVEDYLQASPRARAEVADHREVATMLAWSGTDAPEGLWERIAGSLDQPEHKDAARLGQVLSIDERRRQRTMRSVGAWVLASAAAALIAVVAVRSFDRSSPQDKGFSRSVSEAYANPNSTEASLVADGSNIKVRAVIDPTGRGYLLADPLPALDPSRTYQLWGKIDNEVISLGVLGNDPGTTSFTATGDVSLLVITDEVVGGVAVSQQPAVLAGALS